MLSRLNNWYRWFSNYGHPEGPGILNNKCPACNTEPYPTEVPCEECGFEPPWNEPPPFFSSENLLPLVVLGIFFGLLLVVIVNVIFDVVPHF